MVHTILPLLIFLSSFLYGQEAQFILKTHTDIKTYNFSEIRKITFVQCNLTSVDGKEIFSNLPSKITFIKNFPNPFNNSTSIEFTLEKSGNVEILINDEFGNIIKNISKTDMEKGIHRICWDAKNNSENTVSSGSYYCQVKFENQIIINKMIFIK